MSEWETAALHDLLQTSLSIADIASRHGRSKSAIHKLKNAAETIRPTTRGPGMKRMADLDVISQDHIRIGLHLLRLRGRDGKTAFANALGTSAITLGVMENGRHDFTLRQLQAIAELGDEPFFSLQLPEPSVRRPLLN
ncbi:hypothetical protein [Ensifer soli]|uniref:hypothetical protein n=1 Tax=Ciceribacter sp. sgz301302 TaxID=3342379 RepID=UPI0035B93F8F